MTTPPAISPKKTAAWIELMRAQQRVLRRVELALKQSGLPQLAWYDVLIELVRADEVGLRPMELEKRLLLPQYGMSRLLDRMEKAGFVDRVKAPEDGRGQIIRLTAAGRDTQATMWPVYAEALEDAFGSKLSIDDASTLRALLRKLKPDPEA